MHPDLPWRRLGSAALALLILVSSLTCMTVACRVVCAAESGPAAATSGADDLPPCHRAAAGGHPSTAPTSAPSGGCSSGAVCCSTWIQDRVPFQLTTPILLREPAASQGPALAPGSFAAMDAPAPVGTIAASDPPGPLPAAPRTSRASRAPPAA
jgi:hypothetical protein